MKGIIYTETTIYSPPEAFVNDAPYQLVIVELDDGSKLTARVAEGEVHIGDAVELLERRNEISYFRKV